MTVRTECPTFRTLAVVEIGQFINLLLSLGEGYFIEFQILYDYSLLQ